MNIVFCNMEVFSDQPYANWFLKALKASMSNANLIQLTDRNGVKLEGVNEVVRGDFEWDRNEYPKHFLRMISELNLEEMIYTDVDMLYSGSIANLMEGADWDVSICNRGEGDGTSEFFRKFYPYNIGLVITRSPYFWKECYRRICEWKKCESDLAQHIVGWVIDNGDFRVRFLDGSIYNRTPKNEFDHDDKVKIWHFKGGRKTWMEKWLQRWRPDLIR